MKIGIFWIYKNEIFTKKEELKDIVLVNGFKDSNLSHYKVWEEIKSKHKDFYLYEYEDIPRGRVVYDNMNELFLIYCNKDILSNKKDRELILKDFEINSRYKFIYDEHYRIFNSPQHLAFVGKAMLEQCE